MKRIITNTPAETEDLAAKIGNRLKGGETIELVSDLGGGKTTFVRGLAKGAGSENHVSSPTFTISKVYKTPKFDIHHFDFYRLPDAGVLEHELHDLKANKHVVLVIEWAEIVKHVLPEKRLSVSLTSGGENERVIELSIPNELEYLVETL